LVNCAKQLQQKTKDYTTPGYSLDLQDQVDQMPQWHLQHLCFVKKPVAASARAAAWFNQDLIRTSQF
jgi:CRISPR/Cas system Type II protein with McrA/HNH and RuvC-like nuclease domain